MGDLEIMEKMSEKRNVMLQDMRDIYYWHVHRINRGKNEPTWRGVRVVKYPTDLLLYSEVIFANKPDFIIETGTRFGGSALFFADMLDINGKGRVISIDIDPIERLSHPRITYLLGPSTDVGILNTVQKMVKGSTVMVVLDSDHSRRHVKRELSHYGKIVTKGQYMVAEDCYTKTANKYGPGEAVDWYLQKTKKFVLEPLENKFLFAVTRGGWLRKI